MSKSSVVKGSGMASSTKSVTGGAAKVLKIVLTVFVLFVAIKTIGPLMDAAGALGAAITTLLNAVISLLDQIAAALNGAANGGAR